MWAGLELVLGNCLGSIHGKSVRDVPTRKCLGKLVPIIPRHTITEAIVVSMGQLKKLVLNTREEM